MATTPAEVLQMIRDVESRIVDVRFTDLPGVWQDFSIPA